MDIVVFVVFLIVKRTPLHWYKGKSHELDGCRKLLLALPCKYHRGAEEGWVNGKPTSGGFR